MEQSNDTKVFQDLQRLYVQGNASEAVVAARQAWPTSSLGDQVSSLCGAIFIDRGGEIDDRSAIEDGISIFAQISSLPQVTDEVRIPATYNLANGYGALAKHYERAGDKQAREEAWKQERGLLQELLLQPDKISSELLPKVLANFANALSHLGRKVEALDYHLQALALVPDHPMAQGSAGQVTLDLLEIQRMHNVRLVARSRQLLRGALADEKALIALGGEHAVVAFKGALSRCDDLTAKMFEGGVPAFDERIERLRTHSNWKAGPPISDWISDGLLLTVNPYPEWCSSTAMDDLFFDGLDTAPDDTGDRRFTDLAHTLNQIKEEFATGRYLYSASRNSTELSAASALTAYADTFDYADFGLSSGLLKASIRLSADALDKVANFLNRYLELGIPERKVSFMSVWYEKGDLSKNRKEGVVIGQHLKQNTFLSGIKDVAETLNVFPAPVKDIRNKVTHDFLIIENMLRPSVRLHGKIVATDAHEFARQLLIMTKGVIVSLIAFVQRTETLKRNGETGLHIPMTFRYGRGISDQLIEP